MLSDLVNKLFTEVGLDKSLVISYDIILAASGGEDKGDDLCRNSKESVSGCRCPATFPVHIYLITAIFVLVQ